MPDQEPIGEVILTNIDRDKRCCTLSICLQNDSVKNRGFGTQAETLALEYVFGEMEMLTVFAGAVLKNRRSQHVLKKVGFRETHRDETFQHYRCDRDSWQKTGADFEPSQTEEALEI